MQTSLIGEELVDQICFGISLGELWIIHSSPKLIPKHIWSTSTAGLIIRPAVYWTVGRGSFPLASKSVSFSLDWHQDIIWAESTVERTPPYCHLFITETSLLQPLFLATWTKLSIRFFCKETFVNTANIFWPLDDRKNGVLLYEFSACYSSLLWIVCCPWGKKAHTFSLNSTLLIWTPH